MRLIVVSDKHRTVRTRKNKSSSSRSIIKDLAVTLTSTRMTTSSTTTPTTTSACSNGGVLVDGSCHCPSGYGGIICQQKFGKLDLSYFFLYWLDIGLYWIRYSCMWKNSLSKWRSMRLSKFKWTGWIRLFMSIWHIWWLLWIDW